MTSSIKPYDLTFTERPEYLYAEIKGNEISTEMISSYIRELVAMSEKTQKARILLYRDIPAVLSGGEIYFTVNESLDALADKKLALVNPYPSLDEGVDFGITVGQNRGGNYRSFNNVTDAEAWLLEG